MTNPDLITCETLEQQLADYLADALPQSAAEQLEAHAASCARCEVRLEAATRRPLLVASALPPSLRDDTLRAVQARRVKPRALRNVSHAWRWRSGLAVAAAAALLVVLVNRDVSDQVVENPIGGAETVGAVVDSPGVASAYDGVGMRRSAARLADDGARSEFAELAAAAGELEVALAATPDDRQLRAFLSTVRARRDELARRVKEAKL